MQQFATVVIRSPTYAA